MVQIHNEDCFVTMERMNPHSVDVVLTSPFYNTNKKAGKTRTLKNTKVADGQYDYVRYDSFVDDMTDDEYSDFTKRLFLSFDKVLSLSMAVYSTTSITVRKTPKGCLRPSTL